MMKPHANKNTRPQKVTDPLDLLKQLQEEQQENTEEAKEKANAQEVFSAFNALTNSQILLLHKIANSFKDGSTYESALDLIHEALYRTVNGTRTWHKDVEFVIYMYNAMRSIVSYERKATQKHRHLSLEQLTDEATEQGEQFINMQDANMLWTRLIEVQTTQSPEEHLMDVEFYQQLEIQKRILTQRLKSDQKALQVLEGFLSGWSARQIIKEFNLPAKDYELARTRLMRQIKNLHLNR